MGNGRLVDLCSALLLSALLAACGGDGVDPHSAQKTMPLPLEESVEGAPDPSPTASAAEGGEAGTAEEEAWVPPQNWCGTPGAGPWPASSVAPDSGVEVVRITGDLKLVHPDGRVKRVSATEYYADAELRAKLILEGWRVSMTRR